MYQNNFKIITSGIFLCALGIISFFPETIFASEAVQYKQNNIWPKLSSDYYFYDASAVAVDHYGFIYIADTKNNRIIKYTHDGRLITQWGTEGSDKGQFNHVFDIIFDGKKSLYAVDTNNQRIQQFSLKGAFIHSWPTGESSNPRAAAIDTDGVLYVVDHLNHKVQIFSHSGDSIAQWGTQGSEEGELKYPVGIAVYTNQNDTYIYVLDESPRIQAFLPDGTYIEGSAHELQSDSIDQHIPYYANISIDRDGMIYIPDQQIFKYNPFNKEIEIWGEFGDTPDRFQMPVGITIDKDEIFITDWDADCVKKFTKDGVLKSNWGYYGDNPGQMNHPNGMTWHNNILYVADTENHRIQKFSTEGHLIGLIGSYGNSQGYFNQPADIAVDSNSNMYIADRNNKRVQKIGTYGNVNIFADHMNDYPDRITIDQENHIFLASYSIDQNQQRHYSISKFETNGSHIFTASLPEQYSRYDLQDIAVTQDGNIMYVIFQDFDSIIQLNSEGQYVDTWMIQPEQSVSPAALALDSSGNLFIEFNSMVRQYSSSKEIITSFTVPKLDQDRLREGFRRGLCVSSEGSVFLTDDYSRIQVFSKASDINNKAIIIAGGSNYQSDRYWDIIQIQANQAYQSLIQMQWKKENIYYLSSNVKIDPDTNNKYGDVDCKPTHDSIEYAITEWAEDADSLLIYMIGHGGEGTFRLNSETEDYTSCNFSSEGKSILQSTVLDEWLDRLQQTMSGKIIVICDAHYSESFVRELQSQNRIVIGSALSEQHAVYPDTASLSFSSIFFREISNDVSIKNAFLKAKSLFKSSEFIQVPCLDANSNKIFNEDTDYDFSDISLSTRSTSSVNLNECPVIGDVSFLSTNNAITITASNIISTKKLNRVFGVILPLQKNTDTCDYPVVEFNRISGNFYNGTYKGDYDIKHSGQYRLAIFARDQMAVYSEPHVLTISSEVTQKNIAMIIVGNTGSSSHINNSILAYNALKFQQYSDEDIFFFCDSNMNSKTNGIIDDNPSLSGIESFLLSRNVGNTNEIIFYFIGNAKYKRLYLNESEYISGSQLNEWIKPSIHAVIIIDAYMGKSFLRDLESNNRILISSALEPAYSMIQGNVSFSHFFWSQVKRGSSTWHTFEYAKALVKNITPDQTPVMIDLNKKSHDHYIGSGLTYFSDEPVAGNANAEIDDDGILHLEVNNASSTYNIDSVWAVISPRDHHFTQSNTTQINGATSSLIIPEIQLFKNNTSFKAETSLKHSGFYDVHFFAIDNKGNISINTTIAIYQGNKKDIYEPDNSIAEATVMMIGDPEPQYHNFHAHDDEDWFNFFATTGKPYRINIQFYGDETINVNIDVFFNEQFKEKLESFEWTCHKDGVYYFRITLLDSANCLDCQYEISIDKSTAGFNNFFIKGNVFDKHTDVQIFDVIIKADQCDGAISDDKSDADANFAMKCDYIDENKIYKIVFSKEKYKVEEYHLELGSFDVNDIINIPLTFMPTITASTTGGGSIFPGSDISVEYGESQTFSIVPDDCYLINNIKINKIFIGPKSSYTFSNVTSDYTICAYFNKYKYYSIENLISMFHAITGYSEKPICSELWTPGGLDDDPVCLGKFENINDIIDVIRVISNVSEK
jgi:sugar lactone lactonase YvrE